MKGKERNVRKGEGGNGEGGYLNEISQQSPPQYESFLPYASNATNKFLLQWRTSEKRLIEE